MIPYRISYCCPPAFQRGGRATERGPRPLPGGLIWSWPLHANRISFFVIFPS
ncbi:hypothetical protein HMPREF3293_00072 [Christensenella minuta]|uniref:Uncharacterized protein n=1 Tax=Christensenella minuta TaxID=626937 RepID=A0A136Q8Z1_9FIRM|nr:hypothetical protein HMPREF3293_00072 [Christensenella minuta]